MKIIEYPTKETWTNLLKRPTQTVEDIEHTVLEIFKEVQQKGDMAVNKYTSLFDGVSLVDYKLPKEFFTSASASIPEDLKNAISLAKDNITKFHKAQKTESIAIETIPGVYCWQEKKPIEKVGLYIPGGTAPLFSSILMLAIPAQLAGCKTIVLCTPPNNEGHIDPAIIYTAQLCGIETIYRVGGIQAIAAMTFGTDRIPQVYKIFGPGNQYVTVAKQLATKYGVAIDMPAGPSELLIVADDTANPAFVASDLLSQAEHGIDSQVILVTTSQDLLKEVANEMESQLASLSRKHIAEKAIQNSKGILVKDHQTALELINTYGPEHFIICTENEEFYSQGIENAGSVFIGNYTPESAGDYASGTNHTLPTNGYAKQYSGVGLDSFMKRITFQKISKDGIMAIGPAIEKMALAEGLTGHKNAVSLRLKSLQ